MLQVFKTIFQLCFLEHEREQVPGYSKKYHLSKRLRKKAKHSRIKLSFGGLRTVLEWEDNQTSQVVVQAMFPVPFSSGTEPGWGMPTPLDADA